SGAEAGAGGTALRTSAPGALAAGGRSGRAASNDGAGAGRGATCGCRTTGIGVSRIAALRIRSRWSTTAEPMITAMSAVENAAAHLRLIPKTTPNGGRRRVVAPRPRRMRAARSAAGGDVVLARQSESAVPNSDAAAP